MSQTKLQQVTKLGQSVWMDYIQRSMIKSGELESYIDRGIRGMTSNPAIFTKAITETDEYNEQIRALTLEGKSVEEIYEALVVEDIRMAADELRPLFNRSRGSDGYVSLEVNPHLAHDRQGTVNEAKHLFSVVDRPNIMIKVPGTSEGMLAYQELIRDGMNINVTLLFSTTQYDIVAEAYLIALQERAGKLHRVNRIASVASFFVSRIDVKVDKMLDELGSPEADAIKGKIGIASAKIAYQRFKKFFSGRRWDYLHDKGADFQRLLFGSTSTKNPEYSDVMYVDNLIGDHTVNTIPPKTIDAFLDHGTVASTLDKDVDEARSQLEQLSRLDIDLGEVTRELLDEGIEKFLEPYDKLMQAIAEKQAEYAIA